MGSEVQGLGLVKPKTKAALNPACHCPICLVVRSLPAIAKHKRVGILSSRGMGGQATDIEVGLLLNFGRKPEFKRFVYDNKRKNISGNQRKSVAELLHVGEKTRKAFGPFSLSLYRIGLVVLLAVFKLVKVTELTDYLFISALDEFFGLSRSPVVKTLPAFGTEVSLLHPFSYISRRPMVIGEVIK